MAYPNKIEDEKLKRMLADGKFTDESAREFGVVKGAVCTRIKRLGLTQNYRRALKGAVAPAGFKNVLKQILEKPSTAPAQIIPVTLRLTVEVNVRVNTQGCN